MVRIFTQQIISLLKLYPFGPQLAGAMNFNQIFKECHKKVYPATTNKRAHKNIICECADSSTQQKLNESL